MHTNERKKFTPLIVLGQSFYLIIKKTVIKFIFYITLEWYNKFYTLLHFLPIVLNTLLTTEQENGLTPMSG